MATIILLVILTLFKFVDFTLAVQCDFKFTAGKNELMNNITTRIPATMMSNKVKDIRNTIEEFDCEDEDDEFEVITEMRPFGVDTRFNDDEFESAGSDCVSHKKTIQPEGLNNINNKWRKIINNATFIQSIEIDECRTRNEPCNNGNEPPKGKFLMCRQKFVKVILKALNENDMKVVEEQFYYPSHCICELVQRKQPK